jgi:hypothetical protein
MKKWWMRLLVLSLAMLFAACNLRLNPSDLFGSENTEDAAAEEQGDLASNEEEQPTATRTTTPSPTPTLTSEADVPPPANTPTATVTATPTEEQSGAQGPDNFADGISPLSGLPVSNPSDLALAPAMLSITNWPVSARYRQAGLSYTPWVYELYNYPGESRFLAIYYGELPPEEMPISDSSGNPTSNTRNTSVGPLRSGRLPYESMRLLYNGFLVMASGYSGVLNNIGDFNNYFGSDSSDINSAFVDLTDLRSLAQQYPPITEGELNSNVFDPTPPEGGLAANNLWYIYNSIDQVWWRYKPEVGAYERYQDLADGTQFLQATDSLNGDPLTYENVIILYANHRYCTEAAFNIDLMYIDIGEALLFRDGQAYEIYWTTENTEYETTTGKVRPIRFIYRDGTPFPLKPGQTWVHFTPLGTGAWESTDSTVLFDLLNKEEPGSGNWVTRFFASNMVYDEAVCEALGW